jgi:exodeoxyribonuclease-3
MAALSIITYNLNGIRSAMNKGFTRWLENFNPDMVCIQETKAQPEQVDTAIFEHLGYRHYWFSAEKKGYSGVAVLTKIAPENVWHGCGISQYDREGRILKLDFKNFSLVNTYFPSGSSGEERQAFKMQFLDDYLPLLNKWKKQTPNLLVCGDFNICHKAIDIHDPVGNRDSSGFLPEERAWMDTYFGNGMLDTFRLFNAQPHEYSWWTFRANARARNKGWRIDYITASDTMKANLVSSKIYQDVVHSDHCPVGVRVEVGD